MDRPGHTRRVDRQRLTDQGPFDVLLDLLGIAGSGLFVWVGWAIVTRQPRNTIGWLLFAIPLVTAFAFFVGDYATQALAISPGSLPFGLAAAWLDRWLIVVALFAFIPIFLLFPDGRLPSRRWSPVLWFTIAAVTITVVSFAVTPGRMTGAFSDLTKVRVRNPLGVSALSDTIDAITQIGGFAVLASAFLAGAAIVMRFRSASLDVRQQIRWLAFVGVAFLVEFVIAIVLTSVIGDESALGNAVGNLAFAVWLVTLLLGIPIACGIAILRYHLYDLDIVVRKAVVFGLLAVFITVVYAAIVGLVSASFPRTSAGSFIAAVALAILFAPARDRARKIADRLVYGKRATPYEVLAEFSRHVGQAYASDDVPDRMANVLKGGTGANGARVLLRVGADLRAAAATGEPGSADTVVEVAYQGEDLGALAVSMPPSDPMDPAKRQLVEALAAQAGLVLRNVKLIEELKASRQRLVAAQDLERRRIERDIHDGAQQQLVALSVQIRMAEQLAGRDPERERELIRRLAAQATEALEDLRDLARGIYPPLLADQGLGAALEAQARKAAVPTTVETDGIGRYPQEVESAVYFCTLEALNNLAKYAGASSARIALAHEDGLLTFAISDDGRGFDPSETAYGTGLQGMADRVDAIGGSLEVKSASGRGSTIVGSIPLGSTR